jgi:ribonuclease P protein component
MLPKRERLTVSDIEKLSAGKSAFTALISMRYMKSDTTKASVSVSKKSAKTAVLRNSIRRKMYAALKDILGKLRFPVYMLVMPKKEVVDLPLSSLKREIETLFTKTGLI